MQKDVLFGLRQGTLVLQAIQREMGGLAGVEKLMEETEEARAYQEVRGDFTSPPEFSPRHWPTTNSMQFFGLPRQEVSQMLAGQMSNQDEDEVEDELEALEHELAGPVRLPDAPITSFPENISQREQEAKEKERARARARAKARTAAATPRVPLEA